MTPDANVLLAAARVDHPHHEVARTWLDQAVADVASGAAFTLMPMVVASFLRLVTSPKIFEQPSSSGDAALFIDGLVDATGVRVATLGPEWPRLRALCVEKRLSGNDVPDAWLAAATLQCGEHLVSFDRDFKKLMPRSQFTQLVPAAG